MSSFRAGLVQMTATTDVAENIAIASAWIKQAAKDGAHYVQTPEVTSLMHRGSANMLGKCVAEQDDTALKAFQGLAAEESLWLHIGSLPIKISETQIANRAFFIAPDGSIKARYDKIHMFDVNLPDGETIRESSTFRPGEQAVMVDTPLAPFGLSICYDLRFAGLYRALAHAGAKVLTVPAAFTKITGQAHWHVLLRARAIETGCFVLAAGQVGQHQDGRQTYGHSLIVAPWGEVLADGGDQPGVVVADIDLSLVDEARGRIPTLTHDRDFGVVKS